MPQDFLMPKLGLTMEEGTILEWLVADGSSVRSGDEVLAIETDKTETYVSVNVDGTLHQTGAVGGTYRCGEPIGWLGIANETAVAIHERRFASPHARRLARDFGVDLAAVNATGPNGRVVGADLQEWSSTSTGSPGSLTADQPSTLPSAPPPSPSARPVTDEARELAELLGVNLAAIELDPIERGITREAVARYVRDRMGGRPAAQTVSARQTTPGSVPLTGMRGTIAKRMHHSLTEMAQLTLHMTAEMGAVAEHRRRRAASIDSLEHRPTLTDYVLAAASRALHDHPMMNSQVDGDFIVTLGDVHLGLAVAVDDGLVVPIIRNANLLGLDAIAKEAARLAALAKARALKPTDLELSTFSVTTLGSLDVDGFTPIVNPPNAGILGVGRLRDELILLNGEIAIAPRLTLSLTWDHRVLDGVPAARFCQSVVAYLASPESLE